MTDPKSEQIMGHREVSRRYIDDDTGVIMHLSHEEKIPKRRPRENRERQPFGMVMLDGLTKLGAGLTGYDYRVLLQLVRQMDFEAPFRPYLVAISEATGIAPQNVATSMKHLRDKGLVIPVEDRKVYIDPTIFWAGSAKARIVAIHQLRARGVNLPIPGKD